MGEKWPVSQQPRQQYRCRPRRSLCPGSEQGPLLSQRPGLKASMDLWTYPMIIPWAMSCEGGDGMSADGMMRETERWNVKRLHLGRTGREKIMRSMCYLHDSALGCRLHTAPRSPGPPAPRYAVLLLGRSLFWLSIIKEDIWLGARRKCLPHFRKVRRVWWDTDEFHPTMQSINF